MNKNKSIPEWIYPRDIVYNRVCEFCKKKGTMICVMDLNKRNERDKVICLDCCHKAKEIHDPFDILKMKTLTMKIGE